MYAEKSPGVNRKTKLIDFVSLRNTQIDKIFKKYICLNTKLFKGTNKHTTKIQSAEKQSMEFFSRYCKILTKQNINRLILFEKDILET